MRSFHSDGPKGMSNVEWKSSLASPNAKGILSHGERRGMWK